MNLINASNPNPHEIVNIEEDHQGASKTFPICTLVSDHEDKQ